MIDKSLPVAVIDSGIGGATVLRELLKVMPNENYIYFGDSANAPYGTKTVEQVQALTVAMADRMLARGIKGMVIACNTATAAAAAGLREAHPEIPIIGIEPAVKPAALAKENPTVLVMATPLTLKQEKFMTLLHRYTDVAQILPLPCPGLAELIESGDFDSERVHAYLRDLFAPFNREKIDSIVLGCTHYPLVSKAILEEFGRHVELFYGGEGTARQTRRRLEERGTRSDAEGPGRVEILNSSDDPALIALTERILRFEE